MAICSLIFINGIPFRTYYSREMAKIIMRAKMVPKDYNIPSREVIRGPILDTFYAPMRERHKSNLLIKA